MTAIPFADYVPPIYIAEQDFSPEGADRNRFHYFVDTDNLDVDIAKKCVREALEYLVKRDTNYGQHNGMLNDLGRLNMSGHRKIDEWWERGANYVGWRPGYGNMIHGNRTPNNQPLHAVSWTATAMCELRKAIIVAADHANRRGWTVTQYMHSAKATTFGVLRDLQMYTRSVVDLEVDHDRKRFVLGTELEGTVIQYKGHGYPETYEWFIPDIYLCAMQPLWVAETAQMQALIDCYEGNAAMEWYAETFKEFGFGKQ